MPKIKRRRQFAALPFQAGHEGIEVMLVTSRDTGRWVIPKGWPMKNRRPHRAAAIEAYEEAGVVGKADKTPLGTYDYEKRTDTGAIACRVTVFPLPVSHLLDEWPESAERRRAWHSWEQASELVEEPELQAILHAFGSHAEKRLAGRVGSAKATKDERGTSRAA